MFDAMTLRSVANTLSQQFGVSVLFDAVHTPHVDLDNKVIHLPPLQAIDSPETLGLVRFYLDHETGHIAAKSRKVDYIEAAQTSPFCKVLLNVLDDRRVERFMIEHFPGVLLNWRHAMNNIGKRRTADLAETGGKMDRRWQLIEALNAYERYPMPAYVDHDIVEFVEKWGKRILKSDNYATSERTLALAKEIREDAQNLPATNPDEPTPPPQPEPEPPQAQPEQPQQQPQAQPAGEQENPQPEEQEEPGQGEQQEAGEEKPSEGANLSDEEPEESGDAEGEGGGESQDEEEDKDREDGDASGEDEGGDEGSSDANEDAEAEGEGEDEGAGDEGDESADDQGGEDGSAGEADQETNEEGDGDDASGEAGNTGEGDDQADGQEDDGEDADDPIDPQPGGDAAAGGSGDSQPAEQPEDDSEAAGEKSHALDENGFDPGQFASASELAAKAMEGKTDDMPKLPQRFYAQAIETLRIVPMKVERNSTGRLSREFLEEGMESLYPHIGRNWFVINKHLPFHVGNAVDKPSYASPSGMEAEEALRYLDAYTTIPEDNAARVASKRFQRLMQTATPAAWRETKSGRVNPRRLATMAAGLHVQNPMRRKTETREVDTSLYLLIDHSGSMVDARYHAPLLPLVCAVARFLLPLCATAKVSTKVVSYAGSEGDADYRKRLFTARGHNREGGMNMAGICTDHLRLLVAKDWNTPMSQADLNLKALPGIVGGATPTNMAVQLALSELANQPTARRILIVLTDGAPTGDVGLAYIDSQYRGNDYGEAQWAHLAYLEDEAKRHDTELVWGFIGDAYADHLHNIAGVKHFIMQPTDLASSLIAGLQSALSGR